MSDSYISIGPEGSASTTTSNATLDSSGELTTIKSVTSSFPTHEDSGLAVTFDANTGDIVLFIINSVIGKVANTPGGFYSAYQIDGGSDNALPLQASFQTTSASQKWLHYSLTQPIPITTDGTHTIKWRVAVDGGGTWDIGDDDSINGANSNRTECHVVKL